jgi:hypothetical protein
MAGAPPSKSGGSISIGAGALEEAFETRPHLQRYATRLRRLVRARRARRLRGTRHAAAPPPAPPLNTPPPPPGPPAGTSPSLHLTHHWHPLQDKDGNGELDLAEVCEAMVRVQREFSRALGRPGAAEAPSKPTSQRAAHSLTAAGRRPK